ncbi:MAG: PaaI family thioesterase [Dehalococcoidia bacterium]|nr:PaaI family thioesterase [Dehalococcoidia bacterium]
MLPWEEHLASIDLDVVHYNYCFGCGSENPLGLKLRFEWDGTTARTTFTAQKVHQGWPGTMHGGLLCAILDEAIGWAAYYQGIKGVTGELVTRLKRPVLTGQTIVVEATSLKTSRKLVKTKAFISLPDGTVAAEAVGTIYVMPQSQEAIS